MKKNIFSSIILICVLLFGFSSCVKEPKVEPAKPKGRTILAYLAGDHNLSHEVPQIQESLMKGWGNSKINGSLIVLADNKDTTSPLLIQIRKLKNGKVVADTIKSYAIENSASPTLLKQVIADTKRLAPSDSYGMLLFSHASGWLPEGVYPSPLQWEANVSQKIAPRSILYDNGDEMELADFAQAIPDGMFEFIASEMCFMAGVEVAYTLRNKTEYLLASAPEVLSPGFLPVYETSLDLLYKPKPNLKQFAQDYFDVVSGYEGDYKSSAAISLIKTSEMEALAAFTRKVSPSLSQDQIDRVQYYDRIGKPHLFFDFKEYFTQIASSEQMAELDELLSKAVLLKLNTPKLLEISINKHSGLSVYIPQAILPNLNEAYTKTDWYKATAQQ